MHPSRSSMAKAAGPPAPFHHFHLEAIEVDITV